MIRRFIRVTEIFELPPPFIIDIIRFEVSVHLED